MAIFSGDAAIASTRAETANGNAAVMDVAAWVPNTAYKAGDLVTYNGVTYKCVQPHTSLVGWEPPNVPALWSVVTGTPTATTPVVTTTPVATTTPVMTTTPVKTTTPVGTTTPVATTTTVGIPAWTPNTAFKAGDLVTFNGLIYKCLQPHTSLVGWEPPNAPALWQLVTGTPTATTPVVTTTTPTVTGTTPTVTGTTPTVTVTPPPPPSGYEKVAYFDQWSIYGNAFYPSSLIKNGAINNITTMIYAFENIDPVNLTCFEAIKASDATNESDPNAGDGAEDAFADYQKSYTSDISVDGVADTWSQPIKGNFNQLKKLKAKYPNLKILLSLGGWTYSKYFSDAAATDASRQKLVSSCIDLV
jgi:chitinase